MEETGGKRLETMKVNTVLVCGETMLIEILFYAENGIWKLEGYGDRFESYKDECSERVEELILSNDSSEMSCPQTTEMPTEKARELWTMLRKDFDFKRI